MADLGGFSNLIGDVDVVDNVSDVGYVLLALTSFIKVDINVVLMAVRGATLHLITLVGLNLELLGLLM